MTGAAPRLQLRLLPAPGLLLAALLLPLPRAEACLEGYSVALLREQPPADLAGALAVARPTPAPGPISRRIDALREALDRGRADENDQTDLAVLEADAGRLPEAEELLLMSEASCPRFESAASLGSVYQKMGDLPRARLWLRIAAERATDPARKRREQHHEAMVALRLEQRDDRMVLERRNFLNLDFGAAELPVRPAGMVEEPALLLSELLPLFPESRNFADLWLVAGELARLGGLDPALARDCYLRARTLGHPRVALLRIRMAGLERLDRDRWLGRWAPLVAGLALATAAAVVWRLFRRRA